MSATVLFGVFAVLSYLMGSFSSAIFVCKLLKLPDPRAEGSKNPGATNVLRLAGKKAAAIVLAGDLAKGFVPVLLARCVGIPDNGELAWIGACAFLGHLYPLFFRFKGGKGVATTIGVTLGLSPLLSILFIITWLLVARCTRYSSLAALIATIAMPFYSALIKQFSYLPALIFISGLIIWRHRKNIQRLKDRQESPIEW